VHSTRGIRKRRSGQHRHVADEQTDRVCAYRSHHQLPAHSPEARAEQLTLEEAAEHLDICPMTLRRLIGRGLIPALQPAPGVPWIIKRAALHDPSVQRAVETSNNYRPRTPSRNNANLRTPGT
jgi:excisionase family DNA binding protein